MNNSVTTDHAKRSLKDYKGSVMSSGGKTKGWRTLGLIHRLKNLLRFFLKLFLKKTLRQIHQRVCKPQNCSQLCSYIDECHLLINWKRVSGESNWHRISIGNRPLMPMKGPIEETAGPCRHWCHGKQQQNAKSNKEISWSAAGQAKKNFSSSEVEVLLQEITWRRKCILSSLSAGYTSTNKKEKWEAVTRAVDAVSGEGRTIEEVKKKWFDLKSET